MAYRKSSWRKLKPSQVLPTWTPTHSDTVTVVFHAAMQKLGITDFKSYHTKLRIPIIVCTVLCAAIGAADYGFTGLLLGGLLGFTAPVVFISVGVMLTVLAIYLLIFCAVWAVILYVLWWLLHS